ncbi:MAG TPA: ATP-binding cassette domain-containing protein [Clostridia bacterium]|nr:ATP-binding cassette domain-containing protein [Clostridia bacterium]
MAGTNKKIKNNTGVGKQSFDESEKNILQPDLSSENMLLTVTNLNYGINDKQILKNIDLSASKGEFIGLIGPNGAGKTTLLKCVDGIYKGTGRIEIGGAELGSMNSREIADKVAMLHQDTSVTFPFTVLDVVLMGRYHLLGRFKAERPSDYEAARRYMEYTDTLELEDRSVNTLSGGERQRVLLAKALAQEAGLILLDEPSASLDIAYEEQTFRYSAELCRNGKTVIAAVHDLKTAVRFCSRLILMKDGHIIADGAPEEVVTRQNLLKAYGVNALVYKNRISGFMDFHIPGRAEIGRDKLAHVIGGGGSASAVIRQLFEGGYNVTAGVFAHGDSDLGCTDVFGVTTLVCQPFSEIDDETFQKNVELVRAADFTILCDMPFGQQNIKNLKAAAYSENLIIIEDENPGNRDFTGGKAMLEYSALKKHAVVIESARLHEVLP